MIEYTDLMKPETCWYCGCKLKEDEDKFCEKHLIEFVNLEFDKIKEEKHDEINNLSFM